MKRTLPFLFVLVSLPSAAAAANLTVDHVWTRSKVILYELPEADGRAEAIRYVESMRDRFKAGAGVLDAAANRSSLPERLKDGFILYTTLGEGSELLRLAVARLGWEGSGGVFRWHELTAPNGELRIILVGKNPYARGYCVIFAAGSNRALVGIHDAPHGAASYGIFQGDRLLRDGNYDENFNSTDRLTKTAALEDVNQFFRTLKRVHPNLLVNVSEAGYRTLKEQTAAGVAARLDARGEIGVEELASLLYYGAAYFKDGHTALHWQTPLSEWNTRGKRFPALRLRFDNGHFVIAAARNQAIVGMELTAVNGAPVLEFLRPVLDRCSGETLGFRAARFLWNEPFWYSLTNLFGAGAEYLLTVRDAEGQSREVTLETLDFADYQAFRKQDGVEPFHPNDQGTKVEFFDSGATAHFLYSSFRQSAEEKKKIDAVFEEIKKNSASSLILDLRGNGGGQSEMAEYIFRYLYDGKFRSFRTVRVKVSWDILPLIPWWARPLAATLRGIVFSVGAAEKSVPKPGAFFPGRTYLLTDNGSYSMAVFLAAMVRDYKAGTILGYETGGLPHTFGGPYHFILKNSRIPCSVSWTENFPAKPWPGDDDHGVIPDVPLSDRKLADFRTEQDPVLAFALRYVKAGAAPFPAPQQ